MNNPLKFVDPSGDIAFIAIVAIVGVVGGTINLATNWNNVNSFGDGLYYFGVGAAVGAGATVGGAALAPVLGTGALAGAVLGAAGGFVTGYANTGYATGDWGKSAISSGAKGAIFGAISGGVIAGGIAGFSGNNVWTGAKIPAGQSIWSLKGGNFKPGKAYNIFQKDFWKYGKNLKPSIEIEKPIPDFNKTNKNAWDKNSISKYKAELGLSDELKYTTKQIGDKYGEHMGKIDGILDHIGYLNKAKQVYSNPNQIIRYPVKTIPYGGETHFIMDNLLLRLDPNGLFRSLYPF